MLKLVKEIVAFKTLYSVKFGICRSL